MSDGTAKLTCQACGRAFAWKPQYAGKSLKCACGNVIKAPATAPRAVAAAAAFKSPPPPLRDPDAPPSLDDLDDAVAHAEYELAHSEQPTTARVMAAPVAAAVASGRNGNGNGDAGRSGPTSPMLAYAGTIRRPPAQQKDAAQAQVANYFIPLGLITAGVLAMFFDAHLMARLSPSLGNPLLMIVFVVAKCAINLLLVCGAVLAAVKIADLGLGELGPAMLKIAAAALLPAAIGDIVAYYLTGYVSWGVCLLMYAGLLYYLFDMDLMEIGIVAGIIWVVQTWIAMLIIGLIFTGVGGAATGAGVLAMSHPVNLNPEEKIVQPPDDVDNNPKAFDQYAHEALDNDQALDSREWLHPKYEGFHLGGPHSTRKQLLDCVTKLYMTGAQRVYASQFKKSGKGEVCTEFIVFLPLRPAERKPVLAFGDDCVSSIHPTTDTAQEYIQVLLK